MPPILTGSHFQTVDERARCAVPSKLVPGIRKIAGVGDDEPLEVVITVTPQQRLGVFPRRKFMELLEILEEPAQTDGELFNMYLDYVNNMDEQTLDKQHRFRIPQNLQEFFGLEGEVVVLGSDGFMEVVNKHTWKKQLAERLPNMSTQASLLMKHMKARRDATQNGLNGNGHGSAPAGGE